MEPQAETRLWQRLVAAETAIEKLQKSEIENRQLIEITRSRQTVFEQLEKRIEILEAARQRQIAINGEVADELKKLKEKPIDKPIPPKPVKKSYWSLFWE